MASYKPPDFPVVFQFQIPLFFLTTNLSVSNFWFSQGFPSGQSSEEALQAEESTKRQLAAAAMSGKDRWMGCASDRQTKTSGVLWGLWSFFARPFCFFVPLVLWVLVGCFVFLFCMLLLLLLLLLLLWLLFFFLLLLSSSSLSWWLLLFFFVVVVQDNRVLKAGWWFQVVNLSDGKSPWKKNWPCSEESMWFC